MSPGSGTSISCSALPGSTACEPFAAARAPEGRQGRSLPDRRPAAAPRQQDRHAGDRASSRPGSRATETTGTAGDSRSSRAPVVLQAVPNSFASLAEVRLARHRVLRAQRPRGAARQRDHQPGGEHRLRPAQPDVDVRVQGQRRDSCSRTSPARSRSAARSSVLRVNQLTTSTSRSRSTTSWSPFRTIDFNAVPGRASRRSGGSEITRRLHDSAPRSALATQLRLGALPIKLVQISESQVSATLGAQALHQGLIAGLVGLAVVVAVPARVLPRARPDRGRRPGRLRHLLLRADQADPDHDDARRHRRPDPDDRCRRRREHRHLRARQGGDPRRADRSARASRPATARA